MFGFYIDLSIVFIAFIWIAISKFKLVRILPCVSWAYGGNKMLSGVLYRNRFKLTLSLVFSLLCIIFFGIRFYLVLQYAAADTLVCFALPIFVSLYGAYVVFFSTVYNPIFEVSEADYLNHRKSFGLTK